ncbi:MAG: GNAT family N-acetyltransferase [Bacteroidetes bacterium]|nr:GNAT family N-acetyltransferase [Bacteroidota bacterium]
MSLVIRKANEGDLPEVLKMIHELADYEKTPHDVTISLEELRRDGFGPNPIFEVILAESDGQIMGIAFYFLSYSTWRGLCLYLEDIIVKQEFRRQGIGTKLFDAVIRRAHELKTRRLMWQVLDWNKPAMDFYKRYGATFDPTWVNGKLTQEQINTICNDNE